MRSAVPVMLMIFVVMTVAMVLVFAVFLPSPGVALAV